MTEAKQPMQVAPLLIAGVAIAAGVVAYVQTRKPPASPGGPAATASAPVASPVAPPVTEAQLDGHAFPDHVLALTWDDGPDTGTKDLATYLAGEKVAATFFVIESWVSGVSSDPGSGKGVYQTGYSHLPLLADLVKLHHRIGNHTRHHVLLTEVDAPVVLREVRENQERVDPFLTNELRLFRAPGGAWSAEIAKAIAGDPYLAGLVGPIRWDVDRKDWDNSVECRSEHAEEDCDLVPGGHSRVKASVTAERYLSAIDEAKHGIVLFHDRVGDVGSDYAMTIARIVVPRLKERGYVFAAPVLEFGPLRVRAVRAVPANPVVGFADADGDGRADLWRKSVAGLVVQRSVEAPAGGTDCRPFTSFAGPTTAEETAPPTRTQDSKLAAVLGADAEGALSGDLNGDGRDDACGRTPAGFVCAFGTSTGYTTPTVWCRDPFPTSQAWLADINGDGRADLCVERSDGVACGLAP